MTLDAQETRYGTLDGALGPGSLTSDGAGSQPEYRLVRPLMHWTH
jgi:hypothetical protein